MPFKFAANISTMFHEAKSLPERYRLAKEYGFEAVEFQFPYDYPKTVLCQAKEEAGVTQVLLNSYPGPSPGFGFGLSESKSFIDSMNHTLSYAEDLECKRVHIISGLMPENFSKHEAEKILLRNLKNAIDMLEQRKIIGLLEPLCPEVKPNYFLNNFDTAIEYIKKINSPYLRLMLDIYHLQRLSGNLTSHIESYLPYTGHVQISQAPNRDEPNAPGEINYRYILTLLDHLKYDGYIGLEYFPSKTTAQSLTWIEEFGFSNCLAS